MFVADELSAALVQRVLESVVRLAEVMYSASHNAISIKTRESCGIQPEESQTLFSQVGWLTHTAEQRTKSCYNIFGVLRQRGGVMARFSQ